MEELLNSPLLLWIGGVTTSLLILFKSREWEKYSPFSRKVLVTLPIIAAVIFTVFWLYVKDFSLIGASLYAAYSLFTVTVTSIYSDFKWRMARADNIWVFTILSIPYWHEVSRFEVISFYSLLAIGFAGLLLPFFGQSDARVFILSIAVTVPSVGLLGVVVGLLVFASIVLLYSMIVFFSRVSKGEKLSNVSIPAVPLISVSFFISVVIQTLTSLVQ